MEDYSEKMKRCKNYVEALEEERRKIQVFHRELPLCFELVTQAINTCRQQVDGTVTEFFPGRSECSEQTTSEGPVLEQFIPLKRASSSEDEEEQHSLRSKNTKDENNEKTSQKSDWLRSVQLWNQQPADLPSKQEQPRKIEAKNNGGAFHPFHKEKGLTSTKITAKTNPSSADRSLTAKTVNVDISTHRREQKEEKEGQLNRKARRCWSPELHRRFLHALQQLGGSHAATPKQIRDLMKVDGLTNDEVKSHLQKYRLHTRRPNTAIQNNSNPQQGQFLLVSGIWVPPHEYAAAPGATAGEAPPRVSASGIYAPVALPPPASTKLSQQQQKKQLQLSPAGPLHSEEEEGSPHNSGDDDAHSTSPATSSSTNTTLTSPAF